MSADAVALRLAPTTVAELVEIGRRTGLSRFDTLLAACAVGLGLYSDHDEVALATAHGPHAVDLAGDPTVGEALGRMSEGGSEPQVRFELAGDTPVLTWSGAHVDRPTVERLARIVDILAQDPERHLSELELLDPADRQHVVDDWNNAVARPRRAGFVPVHERVAVHAAAQADVPAVVCGDRRLTYGQLEERANRLAQHLRGLGVGPEVVVGLALERGVDLVVAVLGVWKAGGAYLPLDAAHPVDRLAGMLATSQVEVLVGQRTAAGQLAPHVERAGGQVVWLDDLCLDDRPPIAPPGITHPDQLAYVMYTSGTTGRPKGVAVTQGSMAGASDGWIDAGFCPGPGFRWLSPASFGFAVFCGDLVRALCAGGTLVVAPAGLLLSVPDLADLLVAQRINAFECAPRFADQLVEHVVHTGQGLDHLRLLVVTTDVWRSSGLARAGRVLGRDVRLLTAFGITEANDCSYSDLQPQDGPDGRDGPTPIGGPMRDARLYVVDRCGRPRSVGMPGELWVGGFGVARGYQAQPASTAARFVPDPFAADGSRVYRSGDLVRWRPDAQLEHLGRVDDQVNLRGYRVEPAEVEAALVAHAGVAAAVVVARDESGERRLVAYAVPADGAVGLPALAELRAHLRRSQPDYMVPAVVVELAALPVTPNGKVDRAALPVPESTRPDLGVTPVAPRTQTEALVARAWAEALGLDEVGVLDNFFDLGGHSLLATRVVARLRAALGVDLPLAALFDQPTVAAFAATLADRPPDHHAPPTITRRAPAPRDGGLPASFAQRRLWFLHQLEPGSVEYNAPLVWRLTGPLDMEALRAALSGVVERHEVLRTRLVPVDGLPEQVIDPPAAVAVDVLDLAAETDGLERGRAWLAEDATAPFDLATGPMLRARLVRVAPDDHLFGLVLHHVVVDEWSAGVLVREMASLYDAHRAGRPSSLAPLAVQYADFATWQRDWLRGDVLDEQLAYWRERLQGAPTLELPSDRPRPLARSTAGAAVDFEVPETVTAGLRALSREADATLFMSLLAAFGVVLGRYAAQADVVVGATVANRNHPEIEDLVGFFVNTLALRLDLAGDPSFVELLGRVRHEALGGYDHQDLPFERLVEELAPERDLSRNPIIQVDFQLLSPAPAAQPADLRLTEEAAPVTTTIFDLSLDMVERDDRLAGQLRYSTALFDGATVGRIAAHLVHLLEEVVSAPLGRLSELDMLAMDERRRLVEDGRGPTTPFPEDCGIHELIERQATRTPQATAVEFGTESLTYADLDRRANQLAWFLRDHGVGPEVLVGLYVERSLAMVVALLGILKAGGAYVPLDPEAPEERVAYMLADTAAPVVVTHRRRRGALPVGDTRVVCLDDDREAIARMPESRPAPTASPANLAYVIYTSGSTGRPKGVMIQHRGLCNFAQELRWAPPHPGGRVALNAPLAFDQSLDTLLFLCHGHTVVLVPSEVRLLPEELAAWLSERAIDVLECTPSQLQPLLQSGAAPGPSVLLVSGEELGRQLWSDLRRLDSITAWNSYGPTECTIDASATNLDASATPTIGRPLANTEIYILDAHLGLAPLGVAGEVYIGGVGLARGYRARQALSAERFVAHPFAAEGGARLYRTGDVGRYRSDGLVDFLGRVDDQVKIRGNRIEPGEVEVALLAHPTLAEAVVVARDDETGDRRLVGYVVAVGGATVPTTTELRAFLERTLPDYMVPSVFVALDSLPLTPNGKTDRAALPAPAALRPALADEFVTPRGPVEEMLAGIWADVLGLDRVGVRDDFFELGGHSLLATQVVSRIRGAFEVELPLAQLFERPTVARLAAALDDGAAPTLPPIVAVARDRPLPLSFGQQRLWFLEQLAPGSVEYNEPLAWRLRGPLDIGALRAALDAVVTRHEVLRTRLVPADGVPAQVADAPGPFDLPLVDLTASSDGHEQVEQLLTDDAIAPFDLVAGPLFRGRLIRLAADDHVLSLVLHHLVCDQWSTGLLWQELSQLYAALRAGQPSPLAPMAVQYADFAVWQRQWLQGDVLDDQLSYWRARLADAPVLELPTDRPRLPVRSPQGGLVEFRLPETTVAGLRDLSRQSGTTMFMTLLAGFAALLGRCAEQDDVVVGTPIANRNRVETETLVGFFLNTLVMRTDLSGDPTFAELVARVRHHALGAYAHQDLPFEQLVEALQPQRDRALTPLFQVLFDYVQDGGDDLDLAEVDCSPWVAGPVLAKFDLRLVIDDHGADVAGFVEYRSDLFDHPGVEGMVRRLLVVLAAMAADPRRHLSEVSLLDESERRQLLVDWNDTAIGPPPLTGVHEMIAVEAARHPERTAVVRGDDSLSFGELQRRASRLAHHLRVRGVGPDVVVGVCLPRSLDLVVTLLGVLQAGGAYLPLDPDQPADRLGFMLDDSRASVVVAHAELVDALPDVRAQLVLLDELVGLDRADEPGGAPDPVPADELQPDQLAYVIYTSGSTGRPKGVMVTHRGLSNYLHWSVGAYEMYDGGGAGAPLHSSAGFDLTVTSLWVPLMAGSAVVLVDEALGLHGLLARATGPDDQPFGLVKLTPAHLCLLGELVPDAPAARAARRLVVGGEVLRTSDVRAWMSRAPGTRVVNEYGPTETVVGCSVYEVGPGDDLAELAPTVPIGRPIAHTRLYVLDRSLAPVPVGVVGELYVGGAGLARGYARRPALSAERFVADPFVTGERLYRTGDRARWRRDGELEFLGRLDDQLKVRGFRIEPGEVEATLTAHPGVAAAVVVAHGEAAERRLVAYLVPADPTLGGPSPDDLRMFLAGHLPDYMVPGLLVEVPELPVTSNGKVDRTALPPPGGLAAGSAAGASAPRTPTEQVLASMWAAVLDVERVGPDDNFFELGGHSLLATQVISRVRQQLGVELALAQLFDHPRLGRLAETIDGLRDTSATGPTMIERRIEPRHDRHAPAPLSFAQQRLWFLDQLDPGSTEYHVPVAWRLQGPLDILALRAALDAVVARHEVLRVRLLEVDGQVVQVIGPDDGFGLELVDLSGAADPWAEAGATLAADAAQPFDLTAGHLARGRLLRLGPDDHVLSLVFHHVVSDEWSAGVLRRELASLYEACRRGEPSPLPPLALQYPDFALWQRQWFQGEVLDQQLTYWADCLAGAPNLELPTDRPRPPVRSSTGALLEFTVGESTVAGLRELCRRAEASMFMTCMAAFGVVLGRWADQDDVVVGTPIANRNRVEIEDLVGFFVNTLVLRTDLAGDPTVGELLARVRRAALGAYAHQDVPFEQLVDALHPTRDRSRTPLFQVLFTYDDERAGNEPDVGADLATSVVALPQDTSKFDLTLFLAEDGDGLRGAIEYATSLFDPATMRRLADHVVAMLDAVAADPDRHLSELPLLADDEQRQLLSWGEPAGGGQLPGDRSRVLDRSMRLVPAGVPGELFVAGREPTDVGALGDPPSALAERLVADPFAADGSRLCRTGERVRWSAEGQLQSLGSLDRLVSVGGFRVEPAEIESALSAHPDIAAAVVEVVDQRLVAHLLPDDPSVGVPSAPEMRAFLARRFPDYVAKSVHKASETDALCTDFGAD